MWVLPLLVVFSLAQDDYDEPVYYDDDEADVGEWSTSSDWKSDLERDILPKGKDPPYGEGEKVNVQVLFSTFDHVSLDDKEQMMRIHGRFCLVWNDQRLIWNPSDYGGISDLHVSSDDVWIPRFKTSSNMNLNDKFTSQRETVHIYINRFRTPLVYMVTCPRFSVKSGCALDLSKFPHDQHACSFMITVLQWQNVNLYAYNSINEFQAKMRHILTRNDTRPTTGDFTVLDINSTTKWSDGYKLYDLPELSRPMLPIALQIVVFQRHYSAYLATFALPSLVFAGMNVAAALMSGVRHGIAFFAVNICAIGLFIRDAEERFPRYFSRTPDVVLHLSVSLLLASFGLFYLSIREIFYRNRGKRSSSGKFPATGDGGEWKDLLLRKMLSFDFFVILVSSITTLWYIF